MEKTFPFQEDPAERGVWETVLPAGSDEKCCMCPKRAESLILQGYCIGGVWRYRSRYVCKNDLDLDLEVKNRYRECSTEAGEGKRTDACLDMKERAEGFWKHRGKHDPE